MTLPGTDPESYITEYTLVYEENIYGGVHNLSEADEGHLDGGDASSSSTLLLSNLELSDTTIYEP